MHYNHGSSLNLGKPMACSGSKVLWGSVQRNLMHACCPLERRRRLLLTDDVTAYTDYGALQYLRKLKADKPIRGRVAKCLFFLSDFQNLKTVYQPAGGDAVADAPSRCPLHEGATGRNTTKGPIGELGSNGIRRGEGSSVCTS